MWGLDPENVLMVPLGPGTVAIFLLGHAYVQRFLGGPGTVLVYPPGLLFSRWGPGTVLVYPSCLQTPRGYPGIVLGPLETASTARLASVTSPALPRGP